MNPIEAETRRRVWAGVVAMEATTAATLGLPPSLSARHCKSVDPTPIDDELITLEGVRPQPHDRPSVASFIQQTYKLYAVQLRILSRLYSPPSETDLGLPNCRDALDYDRQLEDWAKQIPPHLRNNSEGAALRGNIEELNMQTNVLRARFLNAKILAHRPMLSYLCHRPQVDAQSNDALDQAVTYASARICCKAAVEILEVVTANWHHGQSGAWCKFFTTRRSNYPLMCYVSRVLTLLRLLRWLSDLSQLRRGRYIKRILRSMCGRSATSYKRFASCLAVP